MGCPNYLVIDGSFTLNADLSLITFIKALSLHFDSLIPDRRSKSLLIANVALLVTFLHLLRQLTNLSDVF
jgi:hypothetical protein